MALEHLTVATNGVNLHCAVDGDGPLVILLHGFPECWYSWRHQIAALAPRFRVVAPDLRGYNESDKPEGIAAYALPELVADVRGLIEAFGEREAAIVGHDWGGAIAWTFAMDHPEATRRHAKRRQLLPGGVSQPGCGRRVAGLAEPLRLRRPTAGGRAADARGLAEDHGTDAARLGRGRRRAREGADARHGAALSRAVRHQVRAALGSLGTAGAARARERLPFGFPRRPRAGAAGRAAGA